MTPVVVYRYFTCLLYAHLVISLLFSCVFTMLFSVAFICYYFMHTVYMHELSPLYTHSLGRFQTTLNLHVQILDTLFLLSGVRVIVRFARRLEFLPFDSGILASYYSCFYTFLDFMYIGFSLYSNPFI